MKKKLFSFIVLFLGLMTILSSALKVDAAELYEHEEISYVDLGNAMHVEKDFEMCITGDSVISDAIDINTILSFGFKYTKEVPSRQWFGFLTQNFQWLNNYSVTINNPVNSETGALENGYIEMGYGSDADTMCFGKYEANEHFEVNQKYVMDIGVVEVFSDAARKTKVYERIKVKVYKVVGEEYVEIISGQYDHDRFDETISPSTRGKSFYFYFLDGFSISTGKYYQEAPKYEGDIYEASTKSYDFYQVLDVDANFKQQGSGDYYISGSGTTNTFMSMGVTFTQAIAQRTFVAFNIQYGTSWNGNYSFAFTQNGNITLGYGSDYQTWGFYNFGAFELDRKYIFEYGSVELFGDAEYVEKIGERIVVNVYQTNDDGSYTLMGSATCDVIGDYYEYFPANRRGNCTFIHQISGTSFSCGFYNRDYKGVVVVDEEYHVVDLSYGALYDFTNYLIDKPNYEFIGWYYLDENNRKVEIPGSGVWNYDFSTINDGYYTCEVYANYEPFNCDLEYVIPHGKNHSANIKKLEIGKSLTLANPILDEGYIFKGWYKEDSYVNQVETIIGNEDLTLYAKVEKASKVDFYYNNKIIDTIYVDKNVQYELPNQIGEILVTSLKLNDTTITGKQIFETDTKVVVLGEYKRYTLNYNLNGGVQNSNNPLDINYIESKVLENATKEGSLFGGWYTDSDFQYEVKKLENINQNVTLYARFYDVSSTSEVTIEPSEETPFYLPQLITPNGSVVTIKLFDANDREIELSNKINYYFAEEGTYTLKYHIETLYGESLDKDITVIVKVNEVTPDPTPTPTPTPEPGDDKKGCNGSLVSSIFGLVTMASVSFFVCKKKKNDL